MQFLGMEYETDPANDTGIADHQYSMIVTGFAGVF